MTGTGQRRLRSEDLLELSDAEDRPAQWRDELVLGSHTVAYMGSGFGRVNALRSTSAVGMPALELLTSLAGQSPTGVVLIEHGVDGLAFCLQSGNVVGAYGTGEHGSMDAWCEEAQSQGIRGRPEHSAWNGLALLFVERCLLQRLGLAMVVGSNLTVIRGEVEWTEARVDPRDAVPLSSILMERAREWDERSKYQKRLAPLSRYGRPVCRPTEEDTSLQIAWDLADGQSTVAELGRSSLLGAAQTFEAIDRLRKSACVELAPTPQLPLRVPPPPPPLPAVDFERLHDQYRGTSILPELIESFMGTMPGWIAELETAAQQRNRAAYARVCGHIIGASSAVAALPLVQVATAAQQAASRPGASLDAPLEAIEAAYGDAFRALLSVHGGGL